MECKCLERNKRHQIQKSWNKIIASERENEEGISIDDDNNLYELPTQVNEFKAVTHEDINTWIHLEKIGSEKLSNDSDSEEEEQVPEISHQEGIESLQKSMLYVEKQPEAMATYIILSKTWKDIATKNVAKGKKSPQHVHYYLVFFSNFWHRTRALFY